MNALLRLCPHPRLARWVVLGVLAVACAGMVIALGACQPSDGQNRAGSDTMTVAEASVRPLPLPEPLSDPAAEISGLTWYGDTLVILPQYPTLGATDGSRRLWGIARADLQRLVDGEASDGPSPFFSIPLYADGLEARHGYEGCEAIAFARDRVYVLTESKAADGPGMVGHLMEGTVDPGLSAVHVDTSTARVMPSQTALRNMSYEAVTLSGDTVLALHEANGADVNDAPYAYHLGPDRDTLGTIDTPTLEYRITDATATTEDGRFWVMNYLYPGERDVLEPATDSVAVKHGVGRSHAQSRIVERLVEYRVADGRIERTATPPIWLRLDGNNSRNWEGVVRFGDGFLIATDRYPTTIFAYVQPSR